MYNELTLGEIAARGPQTRGVLLRHQLDFCCGGRKTLGEACATSGLDAAAISNELTQAEGGPADPEDWATAPIGDVVNYILDRFHEPLRAQLDAVVTAAEKIERVHGEKVTCPTGLAAHLRYVRADLANHMAKEEQVLFPALVSGRAGPMLSGPVTVMMREHDDHGESLRHMRALATNFRPPAGACATWRALYEQLEQLEADLMEHIHLENHVLFPRALRA